MKSQNILVVFGAMASTSRCSVLPSSSRLPCQQPQVDGAVRMEVHIVKTPSGCPVVFESYLSHRTEIEIIPGHTATIDQAPTSLFTTVFPTADLYNTRTIYIIGSGTEARQLTTAVLEELQSGKTIISAGPNTTTAAPLADEKRPGSTSTLSKSSAPPTTATPKFSELPITLISKSLESPVTVVVKETITIPPAPTKSTGTKAPVLEVVKDVQFGTTSTIADQTEATSVYREELPAYTLPPLGGRKSAISSTIRLTLPTLPPGKRVAEVIEITQQVIVPQNLAERLSRTGLDVSITKLISARDSQSDGSSGRARPIFQLLDTIRIPAGDIPKTASNGFIIKLTERFTVPKNYLEGAKSGDTVVEIIETI